MKLYHRQLRDAVSILSMRLRSVSWSRLRSMITTSTLLQHLKQLVFTLVSFFIFEYIVVVACPKIKPFAELIFLAVCGVILVEHSILESIRLGKGLAHPSSPEGKQKSSASPYFKLPYSKHVIFGRVEELANITSALNNYRVVSLEGFGGAGKTSLACTFANSHYPDRTLWISLRTLSAPVTRNSIWMEVVSRFREARVPIQEWSHAAQLIDYHKLLLVIDNCESAPDTATEFITDLLGKAPQAKVLITSQESLNLAHLKPIKVNGFKEDQAIDFLLQCITQKSPTFRLSAAEQKTAAELCRRLAGLPLALEIVAAHVALGVPLVELERQLGVLFDRTVPKDLTRDYVSLNELFDLVFKEQPSEKFALCLLAFTFVGPFSHDAASCVLGCMVSNPFETISTLLKKHVIQQSVDTNMYEILAPARVYADLVYAEDKRFPKTCLADAKQRLVDFYSDFGIREAARIISHDGESARIRVAQQEANIYAALSVLQNKLPVLEVEYDLLTALAFYWWVSGQYEKGIIFAQNTLERTEFTHRSRARILWVQGMLSLNQGNINDAKVHLEEAWERFQSQPESTEKAFSLTHLGMLRDMEHALEEAKDFVTKGMLSFRAMKNAFGEAFAAVLLGVIHSCMGNCSAADKDLKRAARLWKTANPVFFGWTLMHHCNVLRVMALGKPMLLRWPLLLQASKVAEKSITLCGAGGFKDALAWALLAQGNVFVALRRWRDAKRAYREASKILLALKDKGGNFAYVLERIAVVAEYDGQCEKAIRYLGAASHLRESSGSKLPDVDKREYYNALISSLRKQVNDVEWDELFREGSKGSTEVMCEAAR